MAKGTSNKVAPMPDQSKPAEEDNSTCCCCIKLKWIVHIFGLLIVPVIIYGLSFTSWAFGLNSTMGAGCLVFVLIYIAALVPFILHFRNDTPETRARLPKAYMGLILGLFIQALWVPIFMITTKESLGDRYTSKVTTANEYREVLSE